MTGDFRYLFGPVPSRRLGRSLGVDLVPLKTCNFDCVFCQLGRTTHKTLERKEYVPISEVIEELDRWLKTDGQADYITLSGSGEPTLHSGFGEILEFVRSATAIPAVLLTNGALLSDPAVRRAAAHANIVKLSLSAWDQSSLEHINRPHPGLVFEHILEGQKRFREEFRGEIWMEVFIVWGLNSIPQDVSRIAQLAKQVGPDRIQLNTAVRPPAEDFVRALPRERLEELRGLFDPRAEIIAEFSAVKSPEVKANEDTILAMLTRRPCTAEHIAAVFGMHRNEVSKYLGKLLRTDLIRTKEEGGRVFYMAKGHDRSA
ncbi:MAG: radical SAM protein [Phycisphaerae bacterium]|nr:radical SAM protein [Phycisphaerae bacterium]